MTISAHSLANPDNSTSSVEALPARTHQGLIPTAEDLREAAVAYGGKCLELSKNVDPGLSFGKTQTDADTHLKESNYLPLAWFSGVLASAGTCVNGKPLQQVKSVRRTEGSESLLLPTPMTCHSTATNYRRPGQDALERRLKAIGLRAEGQVSHPNVREWMLGLPIDSTLLLEGVGGRQTLSPGKPSLYQENCLTGASDLPPWVTAAPLNKQQSVGDISTPSLGYEKFYRSGLLISFGWTAQYLPKKTVSRRGWKDSHAAKFIRAFEKGLRCRAFDKDPRYGGKQVGWLALTHRPYKELLSAMPESDLQAEGGMVDTVAEFIEKCFKGVDQEVWVIRFRFEPLLSKKVEEELCAEIEVTSRFRQALYEFLHESYGVRKIQFTPDIELFVNAQERTCNGEENNLIGSVQLSPGRWVKTSTGKKTICAVPGSATSLQLSQNKVLLDCLAVADVSSNDRKTPQVALQRQLEVLSKMPPPAETWLVSYDRLIDEKFAGLGKPQRWSAEEAQAAVAETVNAVAFLNEQRSSLKKYTLVMSCQGIDAAQYEDCVKQVLQYCQHGDVIGLGGWRMLGHQPSYLKTFWETINRVIPLIAQHGIKKVHIFGVTWINPRRGYPIPPLAPLLWLCDRYGISLSTDGTSPIHSALRKDKKRSGAVHPYWRDNLAWVKAKLATIRESSAYCPPPGFEFVTNEDQPMPDLSPANMGKPFWGVARPATQEDVDCLQPGDFIKGTEDNFCYQFKGVNKDGIFVGEWDGKEFLIPAEELMHCQYIEPLYPTTQNKLVAITEEYLQTKITRINPPLEFWDAINWATSEQIALAADSVKHSRSLKKPLKTQFQHIFDAALRLREITPEEKTHCGVNADFFLEPSGIIFQIAGQKSFTNSLSVIEAIARFRSKAREINPPPKPAVETVAEVVEVVEVKEKLPAEIRKEFAESLQGGNLLYNFKGDWLGRFVEIQETNTYRIFVKKEGSGTISVEDPLHFCLIDSPHKEDLRIIQNYFPNIDWGCEVVLKDESRGRLVNSYKERLIVEFEERLELVSIAAIASYQEAETLMICDSLPAPTIDPSSEIAFKQLLAYGLDEAAARALLTV